MSRFQYIALGATALIGTIILVSGLVDLTPSPEEKAERLITDIEDKTGLASRIKISPDGRSEKTFPIIRIVDGDTVVVNIDDLPVTLRLIGLNTPETVDPRKPVECFGREASAQMTLLLANHNVALEFDNSQGYWDKYSRLLAYVYREDGLLINKYLIENGYGHEYTYNTPYKFQEEFDKAEEFARENEKGLWAPEACDDYIEQPFFVPKTEPIESDSSNFTCAANTYNCSDFSTRVQAQEIYLACGGVQNDVHKLDADRDGEACESL